MRTFLAIFGFVFLSCVAAPAMAQGYGYGQQAYIIGADGNCYTLDGSRADRGYCAALLERGRQQPAYRGQSRERLSPLQRLRSAIHRGAARGLERGVERATYCATSNDPRCDDDRRYRRPPPQMRRPRQQMRRPANCYTCRPNRPPPMRWCPQHGRRDRHH